MIKLIWIMGILSLLFGCKSSSQSNEIIEITANQIEEDGWQDLIFNIADKKIEDNKWSLKCVGKYKGEKVGFRIDIIEGIEPGINHEGLDNTKFVQNGMVIESIGEESDKLIEVMSLLYKQPKTNKFTADKLSYTIFPLNTEKANLDTGKFKFKLFYDDNNEKELYSEFYINPNFPNGTLELNEKDEEYRSNIIKSMSYN